MNVRIQKLISKLQDEHIKFNQSFETLEEYYEKGEEDFWIWLNNMISEYLKGGIK